MKKLVLLDAHALLHRAYHALPPLSSPQGYPVNAVYGFLKMLFKLREDLAPDYLAVAFDTPKPTFRHQKFVGYQAKRPKMDEELAGQISLAKEALAAMGIKKLEKEGFEADDLLGTLAEKFKKRVEVFIVTGDRDLMQLVDKQVFLYFPQRGLSAPLLVKEKEVEKILGIKPEQVVDYKALAGDSSDNYPGVAGVGPKTAQKLLQKYGSLEQIYQNLAKIKPPSLREKLEKGREAAFLSQELAMVRKDVPLRVKLDDFRFGNGEKKETEDFFKNLGFRSFLGQKKKKEKKSVNQASLF
jgi:DNA polymerase-1